MKKLNRRSFLKGFSCSTCAALASGVVPGMSRMAYGAATNNVLILVNLDGGYDTSAMFNPVGGALADMASRLDAVRGPATRNVSGPVLYGGQIAFHPQLSKIAAMNTAVVRDVGYAANQSRSHQEASIQQLNGATREGMTTTRPGLIGAWQRQSGTLNQRLQILDRTNGGTYFTVQADVIESNNIATFNAGQFDTEGPLRGEALVNLTNADPSKSSAAQAIKDAVAAMQNDVEKVQVAAAQAPAIYASGPAGNNLWRQFSDIIAMAHYIPNFRIGIARIGGGDTHSDQDVSAANGRGPRLYREIDDAVDAAFQEWVNLGNPANRLVIAFVTEFGRNVQQNGSNGTDHGRGQDVFAVGPAVTPNVYGVIPDDPDRVVSQNYFPVTTHVNSFYADLVKWATGDSITPIVGQSYPEIGFI